MRLIPATVRLTFEPLSVDHAPPMFRLLTDPRIYRHLVHLAPPESVEALAGRYAAQARGVHEDGSPLAIWVIRDGDERVGFVQSKGDERAPEIGYLLGPDAWGRGIATEATGALIDHLFAATAAQELRAVIAPANAASLRVVRKLGFEARPAQEGDDDPHHVLDRSTWAERGGLRE